MSHYKWKLFLEQTLLEGRFERAIQKYPEMEEFLNHLREKDPTGRFVDIYSEWLAKNIKAEIDVYLDSLEMFLGPAARGRHEDTYAPQNHKGKVEKLLSAIEEFPKIQNRLKVRDPNAYSSTDKFIAAVGQAALSRKDVEGYKTYLERASQIQGDIIYNNPKELIIVTIADNFEESCDLGYPAWCVSLPSTKGVHYDSYKRRGNRIYFIHHFFVPRSRIGIEEFSKTAIQKEINGRTIVWNEKDNSRELVNYKTWLKYALGPDKGEEIFRSIIESIQEDWKTKAKPNDVILTDRDARMLERNIKDLIPVLLKKSKLYDSGLYQPILDLRELAIRDKRIISSDEMFLNLYGEWIAEIGKVNLSFELRNLPYTENEEKIDEIYSRLKHEFRNFSFPTTDINIDIENDGIINFRFKVYGIIYTISGGMPSLSSTVGFGSQNEDDRTLLTHAIPELIIKSENIIQDILNRKHSEYKEPMFENRKKDSKILIRVG